MALYVARDNTYFSANLNILFKYYYILKQETNIKQFISELEDFIEFS